MRRVLTDPVTALGFAIARAWLTQTGAGASGMRRWQSLRSSRRTLRDNPYLGHVSDEHPHLRHLVSAGYRIIYRIDPDSGHSAAAGDVRILAVFGPGQP